MLTTLTHSIQINYIILDFKYLAALLTQLYAVKQSIYCRKNFIDKCYKFRVNFFHIKNTFVMLLLYLFLYLSYSFSFWSNKTFFSFISKVSNALLYENTLHSRNSEKEKLMYYADNENGIKAKYSRWKKKKIFTLDLFLKFLWNIKDNKFKGIWKLPEQQH